MEKYNENQTLCTKILVYMYVWLNYFLEKSSVTSYSSREMQIFCWIIKLILKNKYMYIKILINLFTYITWTWY